jgi:hypothetical protein
VKNNYFGKNESEVYRTKVIDEGTAWSEGDEGDLICTNSRVVFSKGSEVIDISRDSIDSMEYEPPKYDMNYFYSGLVFLIIGFCGMIGGIVVNEEPLVWFSALSGVVGLGIVLVGFLYRRSSLKIHTPKRTFEFESNNQDLVEVIRTIRNGV